MYSKGFGDKPVWKNIYDVLVNLGEAKILDITTESGNKYTLRCKRFPHERIRNFCRFQYDWKIGRDKFRGDDIWTYVDTLDEIVEQR